MSGKTKRDSEGITHSKAGSVDQQGEDSFPASDSPSFSPGAVGAPEGRKTPPLTSVHKAQKDKAARKPKA